MRAFKFITEAAVDELANKLPTLKRTDYDAIDSLMQRISVKHDITGKKLHDLFVSKYGHTPDTWVKKIKQRNADVVDEHIGKVKSGYRLYSHTGKNLGTYPTHAGAEKREKQVNYFKHIDEAVESEQDVQQINQFIEWSKKTLHVKGEPKFHFSRDTQEAQDEHRTGMHDSEGNITIYIENRNLIDIFRTIFHELVHQRQDELGMIQHGDSYPGSPIEAMADMLAGKYIKIYGKEHPEIFQ